MDTGAEDHDRRFSIGDTGRFDFGKNGTMETCNALRGHTVQRCNRVKRGNRIHASRGDQISSRFFITSVNEQTKLRVPLESTAKWPPSELMQRCYSAYMRSTNLNHKSCD